MYRGWLGDVMFLALIGFGLWLRYSKAKFAIRFKKLL